MEYKDLRNYTLEEIKNLNLPQYNGENFNSFIILPTEDIHDSGYRCMKILCCDKNKPIAYWYSGSDVIHLGGIGGYGKDIKNFLENPMINIPRAAWRIDCLPCGLVRVIVDNNIEIEKYSCSDLQVYSY